MEGKRYTESTSLKDKRPVNYYQISWNYLPIVFCENRTISTGTFMLPRNPCVQFEYTQDGFCCEKEFLIANSNQQTKS